ncbi:hypothetical protein VTN02DRAFT_2616 [Thermoascus thermophilus]
MISNCSDPNDELRFFKRKRQYSGYQAPNIATLSNIPSIQSIESQSDHQTVEEKGNIVKTEALVKRRSR